MDVLTPAGAARHVVGVVLFARPCERTIRGMATDRKKLSDYTWEDMGGGFIWELADEHGEQVAHVNFCEDHGQKWSWMVLLPPDWQFQGPACGLAASQAKAKAICEAILTNTILNG